MKKLVLLLSITISTPVFAQQPPLPPAPTFLERAIASVQTQRNVALDAQAVAEAKLAILTEELAKANAKIKELEPKPKEEEAK